MHEKDIKTSQALPSFVKLCAIVLEKAGASEGRYRTRRSPAAIDDCVDVSGVESRDAAAGLYILATSGWLASDSSAILSG